MLLLLEDIVAIHFQRQIFIQSIKINGLNKLTHRVQEVTTLLYYIKIVLSLHLVVWEFMMSVENVVDVLTL
jgi:hypothetical protein